MDGVVATRKERIEARAEWWRRYPFRSDVTVWYKNRRYLVVAVDFEREEVVLMRHSHKAGERIYNKAAYTELDPERVMSITNVTAK